MVAAMRGHSLLSLHVHVLLPPSALSLLGLPCTNVALSCTYRYFRVRIAPLRVRVASRRVRSLNRALPLALARPSIRCSDVPRNPSIPCAAPTVFSGVRRLSSASFTLLLMQVRSPFECVLAQPSLDVSPLAQAFAYSRPYASRKHMGCMSCPMAFKVDA